MNRKTLSAQETSPPVAASLAAFSSPLLEMMPLESAFRLVLKHMPSNRRRGYYPSSFYRNPLLLISMEMKADSERYMAHVPPPRVANQRRRANTRIGFALPSFGFNFGFYLCGGTSAQDDVVTDRRTTVHGPAGVRKEGSVRMPPVRRESERHSYHAAAAAAL